MLSQAVGVLRADPLRDRLSPVDCLECMTSSGALQVVSCCRCAACWRRGSRACRPQACCQSCWTPAHSLPCGRKPQAPRCRCAWLPKHCAATSEPSHFAIGQLCVLSDIMLPVCAQGAGHGQGCAKGHCKAVGLLDAEWLSCCRDQPGVQGWWLGMQRLHGRHQVVKELEQAEVAAAKLKLQGQIQLVPAPAAAGPLPQPKAECSPAVLDAVAHFVAGDPKPEEVPPEPACAIACLSLSVKSTISLILTCPCHPSRDPKRHLCNLLSIRAKNAKGSTSKRGGQRLLARVQAVGCANRWPGWQSALPSGWPGLEPPPQWTACSAP